MEEQIRQIVLKQLQLIQEKSKMTVDAGELARLTEAMSGILNTADKMCLFD